MASIPFTTSFTVPEGYPERAASVALRFLLLRPRRIVPLAVLLGLAALIAIIGRSTSVIAGVCVAAVVLAASTALVIVRQRKRMRALTPVGSQFAAGFGADAIAIQGPVSTSEVAYRAYEQLVVRDQFVFLKPRNTALYVMLPLALFPEPELSTMKNRIAMGI